LMTDIKDELAELVQFDSDSADPIRIGYQRVAGVK
jgi:hypothetical protein